jgi:hypothetical protein
MVNVAAMVAAEAEIGLERGACREEEGAGLRGLQQPARGREGEGEAAALQQRGGGGCGGGSCCCFLSSSAAAAAAAAAELLLG